MLDLHILTYSAGLTCVLECCATLFRSGEHALFAQALQDLHKVLRVTLRTSTIAVDLLGALSLATAMSLEWIAKTPIEFSAALSRVWCGRKT